MHSTRETAKLLGVKVRTIREWIRTGKIRAQKYPGSRRWYITDEEISRIKGEQ